ncbi:hypothetical protein BZA05DRAFT_97066 [Tricharina praecox]|uniref:uncharacterized protein n=1 Tax=Tricharina praecox TaxID=43433 RepID=UPI00221E74C0|nr:uncharacterized protein BZA05DRAFT_97066 [Tricharina praecox]KAI5848408.1 hypothetical protein BZA05DRAFT_97066 [Tricharina praecox]
MARRSQDHKHSLTCSRPPSPLRTLSCLPPPSTPPFHCRHHSITHHRLRQIFRHLPILGFGKSLPRADQQSRLPTRGSLFLLPPAPFRLVGRKSTDHACHAHCKRFPPPRHAFQIIPERRSNLPTAVMDDGFEINAPDGAYQPEASRTPDDLLQYQQHQQQHQLQQHQRQHQPHDPDALDGGAGTTFKHPTRQVRRARHSKEERSERKDRYDRIEVLARELSMELSLEMSRRKQMWDVEGDREEEEFWESRKQEVYHELDRLASEIQRAFRDRRKEEVLEIWSKEQEERRVITSAGTRPERGRRNPRREEG